MANADWSRILSRVTTTLNANTAGTFSDTISPRNKTRNADEIEAFTLDAAMYVMTRVTEKPSSEYRANFLTEITPAYGSALPSRAGEPSRVDIQPYPGAAYRAGEYRSHHKIEAYRINDQNIYDAIAHNAQGSTLGGYYDIEDDIFYFTGNAAKVTLAIIDRTAITAQIPERWEGTVIKKAVAYAMKAGEGTYTMAIAQGYDASAENEIAAFRGEPKTEIADSEVMIAPK